MLETLWKVVEALIDTCLRASLQMQNVLHGFRAGRGTGPDIMELNLAQELGSIDQDPPFLVFLDLSKDDDTVYRERLLIKLEWYREGPRLCGLLEAFWNCQQVVLIQNVFHGPS